MIVAQGSSAMVGTPIAAATATVLNHGTLALDVASDASNYMYSTSTGNTDELQSPPSPSPSTPEDSIVVCAPSAQSPSARAASAALKNALGVDLDPSVFNLKEGKSSAVELPSPYQGSSSSVTSSDTEDASH